MNQFVRYIAFIALAAVMAACGGNDPGPTPDKVSRTVLVYMEANNNLASDALRDIHEMEIAADDGALDGGGRLLVMRSAPQGCSLLEIVKGASPVTLIEYDVNSSDSAVALTPDFMRRVFADMRSLAPADDYGLVLWSHATGWMDEETSIPRAPQLRSFGYHQPTRARMRVTALRNALEGEGFSWIYFDCCHMGSVEALYELRNCATTFVASPTELPAEGMRYDLNVPLFFRKTPDLVGAARTTFENYAADGTFCSISVVDATKLPFLATATRRVMEEASVLPGDYKGKPFMRRQISPICTIYDMADYMKALAPTGPVMQSWQRALADAVVYSAATPTCLGLDLTGYCGLGSNIIFNTETDPKLFGYDTYAWWTDVVSHLAYIDN